MCRNQEFNASPAYIHASVYAWPMHLTVGVLQTPVQLSFALPVTAKGKGHIGPRFLLRWIQPL